jgi:fluoride exporter
VRDTALVAGVLLIGGLGAVARFAVDSLIQRRSRSELPLGTFAVNVSGSFALGVLAGASAASTLLLLAGTALIGSFTTFSTWMFETERLAEDGELELAVLNALGSLAAGLAAAVAGFALGGAL